MIRIIIEFHSASLFHQLLLRNIPMHLQIKNIFFTKSPYSENEKFEQYKFGLVNLSTARNILSFLYELPIASSMLQKKYDSTNLALPN